MPTLTTPLFLSLALAYAANCSFIRASERAVVVNDVADLKAAYDYVVVGGGTSGLTVADRLTENANKYSDGQEPGVLVPGIPPPDKYFRNYQSIPQPGLNNRTSIVNSAAVVGGGTVVNGMFFNRGSADDYDAWEKLGNPGWGWNDLLPYFIKSEKFTPPPEDLAAQYSISSDLSPHGTAGPVGSSFPVFQYPIIMMMPCKISPSSPGTNREPLLMFDPENFFRGWNEIGIPSNPQPNAGDNNGAIYSTISMDFKNQSRSTASSAHYRPVVGKRPNYHLITRHSVTKLSLDKTKVKATSVHNITSDYQRLINSAAAVDISALLRADADSSVLAGYKAQRDVILDLLGSPHAPVQETAFGGGDTVPVAILRPLSRGTILINSTDPFAPPVFDYGTFSHPTDLAIAVAALKKTRAFMASPAMQEVDPLETLPGAQVMGDDAIGDAIRNLAVSTWNHPVGTLSMMSRKYGGVVDPQLRVYGVKNLRVVDA
ncbi:MAG: hypothetical protein Q9163_006185, partial [Psora crenata]